MGKRGVLPLSVIPKGGKFEFRIHARQVSPRLLLFGGTRLTWIPRPPSRDRNAVPVVEIDYALVELDEIQGNRLLDLHKHSSRPGQETPDGR